MSRVARLAQNLARLVGDARIGWEFPLVFLPFIVVMNLMAFLLMLQGRGEAIIAIPVMQMIAVYNALVAATLMAVTLLRAASALSGLLRLASERVLRTPLNDVRRVRRTRLVKCQCQNVALGATNNDPSDDWRNALSRFIVREVPRQKEAAIGCRPHDKEKSECSSAPHSPVILPSSEDVVLLAHLQARNAPSALRDWCLAMLERHPDVNLIDITGPLHFKVKPPGRLVLSHATSTGEASHWLLPSLAVQAGERAVVHSMRDEPAPVDPDVFVEVMRAYPGTDLVEITHCPVIGLRRRDASNSRASSSSPCALLNWIRGGS